MSSLSRELVFLILQFLDEEKFKETVHKLEKESGFFFNMRYFEDSVTNGEWEEVEKYLSGFTKVDDNRYSMKIFFEIRKQKYLEALDKRDHAKAVEILAKDLKVFSTFNEELFKEITMLLTLQNFRENDQLSKYGDTKSARAIMLVELKKLIEANPLFRDKLQFPTLKNSRLRTLINQSLNWQHQLCKNPKPNPDIKTLFVDHSCGQSNGARAPSPVTNPLMGSIPKVGGFPPIGGPAPFQHAPAPLTNSLAGWMANPSSVPHQAVSVGPMGLTPPNHAVSMLKRPRTPPTNNPALDYQTADSEHVLKRSRPFGMPEENGDGRNLPDAKTRLSDELEKSKIWKLTEISEQSQLRSLRLPDSLLSVRIIRLIYTNSGGAILALAYNAVHKLWKWQRSERNVTGKATTAVPPQLWQPSSGILMTNDISETNLEEAVPCFALSKNDSYVLSASGGKISLFNMMTFKTMTTFMPPPPAATILAFHPQDNNVIAIGMEDSSIQIYNVRVDEVRSKLKGHQKRVTGLAFSNALHVLVSSGADAQICVWSLDGWEKRASKFLQIPFGRASNHLAPTRVQFHQDQTHFLVVHETQIAIYEAPKLECIKQWVPRESSPLITDATYSCDSQSIYTCFEDGSVNVFTAAGLKLRCRINPTAYLPSTPSSRVYPLVITAHPTEPHQFALGLTDGGVHVLEPLETEGKWGTVPPQENGAGPSMSPVASAPDQSSR
ncbi:UNVERIFIED_CONTAM: Topless-related protein 4 [Sesamum radiatum]|uniref:Topless-related protein 4 n=1 Tax=Sesamum radiatum TaxID=300843 RepID=A0AAW2PEU5_SESRA